MNQARVSVFTMITALLTLAVAIGSARADISITPSGGNFFQVVENQIVNGERQITLLCQGNPSMTVLIRATSGSNPIRYINVASVEFAPNLGNVLVSVLEVGGTIPYIRNIIKIPGGWPDVDVRLPSLSLRSEGRGLGSDE